MRVGAPSTLEPGPNRISPPKRLYNFFSDRASHRRHPLSGGERRLLETILVALSRDALAC
jgi:hypothetical protein